MSPQLPNAFQLAADVRTGRRSARAVVEQCLARMEELEPKLNAVALRMDEQALKAADEIDDRVRRGEPVGPLAGVPFTAKECYHVAGTVSSLGRKGANAPFAQTNTLIQRLLADDAILIGKTNLSQLMLLYETDNPRYGKTNHPLAPERSPGGSGGGDAAALAAGYACFSLGTDMGGSTRQPAHSCGLAGLVLTPGMLEADGVERILPGATPLSLLPGVLGRSTADVTTAARTLLRVNAETCDPPMEEMRVAYFESDPYFPACPPVRRAIRESVAKLKAAGVHVEQIKPPSHERALHLYCGMFGADGGERIRRQLRGEEIDSRIKPLLRIGPFPRIVRRAIAALAAWTGDPHTAGILRNSFRCSASTLWKLNDEMSQLREQFFETLGSRGLHAVLGPPHANVAFHHGESHWMLPAACYSMMPNVLGLPAGVATVTTVRDEEENWSVAEQPAAFRHTRCGKIAAGNLKGAAGLPVGVQVMSAPWADSVVLALMDMLENRIEDAMPATRQSGRESVAADK